MKSTLEHGHLSDLILGLLYRGIVCQSDFTVSDITKALEKQGINRCYTTVKTIIDRMAVYGILRKFRKRGTNRTYYKTYLNTPGDILNKRLEWMFQTFFDGDYHAFSQFIREWRRSGNAVV